MHFSTPEASEEKIFEQQNFIQQFLYWSHQVNRKINTFNRFVRKPNMKCKITDCKTQTPCKFKKKKNTKRGKGISEINTS